MKILKKLFSKRNLPGFTLLELLVVISIIGILLALGSAAYSTAQKKGRDARRRGDVKSVQDGFEQYYSANNAYGATGTNCIPMSTATFFPGGLPVDPKGSSWDSTNYNTTAGCTTSTYCICAKLENLGTGNASVPTGGGTTCNFQAGGDYFCQVNLQ